MLAGLAQQIEDVNHMDTLTEILRLYQKASIERKREIERKIEEALRKSNEARQAKAAFVKAAGRGDGDTVDLLLKSGIEANARHTRGNTALHMAALNGHAEVVKILLQANADPRVENEVGSTPVDAANIQGHTEILDILTEAIERLGS